MESTISGLKLNSDIKDSTIEDLNDKVSRLSEEKMRMKCEHDRINEDFESCKRKQQDECTLQQLVAKDKIQKLEEAMSVQQQQHLSSWMFLKSTEVKLSAR